MESFLTTLTILFFAIELSILLFCEYWKEHNIWKWFFIKTTTTFLIVTLILFDYTDFNIWDVIIGFVLGVGTGIDFVCTLMHSKNYID